MKPGAGFRRVLHHAAILAFVVFLVGPLVWLVSVSFKPTQEIYNAPARLIPATPVTDHYETVFAEQGVLRSMGNSAMVGLVSTVFALAICLPGAYALARFRGRLNTVTMGWILTSQIFPVIIVMVPLYVLMRRFGLTDSLPGLTLVYIVWDIPFVLWMLHGYMKGIPVEIEEAAVIDGASRWQVVFRVLGPLILPAVAAAGLFAFISAWNEFFFALVLMKSPDLMTLQIELARFTGMEGQARTGPLAAGAVLATIPSLFLFAVVRRWFAAGLVAGAVKT